MGYILELHISQKQSQTISPHLAESMKILQMNALQLKEYIEEQAMENPVLELEEGSSDGSVTLHRLQSLEHRRQDFRDRQEYVSRDDDDNYFENLGKRDFHEDSLSFFLRMQLNTLALTPQLEAAACWVADNLDDNGWYVGSTEDSPFERNELASALAAIRELEPAGVGAAGLRDCLLLQLERLGGDNELAIRIVTSHLEDLAKSHYNHIGKSLGVSQAQVRCACETIKGLNPRPGSAFSSDTEAAYIRPDITVRDTGGDFEISLAEYNVPELRLSPYYCRLGNETDDIGVRKYIETKARQAKWVIQSIESRKRTVLRCAQIIVEHQESFFRRGGELRPLTLARVAELAEVHESTVSRAIRNRYLQCERGVFAMSSFFSRSIVPGNADSATSDIAKQLLSELISSEDRKKPLSDQKLCELMSERGAPVSRRTVAKYRAELGIAPATGRR